MSFKAFEPTSVGSIKHPIFSSGLCDIGLVFSPPLNDALRANFLTLGLGAEKQFLTRAVGSTEM